VGSHPLKGALKGAMALWIELSFSTAWATKNVQVWRLCKVHYVWG